ncbi:MAG: sigma-70 family RNA polymerase sigma factor [Phycisphaerae bacterium]
MTDASHPTGMTRMQTILDHYERPLTRYAARITGNIELARDVVQETFLRLCSEDPAEVDGHLAQWLYTVCRSRALDVRRKESRMHGLAKAVTNVSGDPEDDPARIVEGQERTGRVLQVLALLPGNQQEVIRLRFQSDLSYKEIASVMSLSVSNVGYLIHTAIKSIRERLGAC